eukprot:944796-Pleurochrysis_carterae.AAC.6
MRSHVCASVRVCAVVDACLECECLRVRVCAWCLRGACVVLAWRLRVRALDRVRVRCSLYLSRLLEEPRCVMRRLAEDNLVLARGMEPANLREKLKVEVERLGGKGEGRRAG